MVQGLGAPMGRELPGVPSVGCKAHVKGRLLGSGTCELSPAAPSFHWASCRVLAAHVANCIEVTETYSARLCMYVGI